MFKRLLSLTLLSFCLGSSAYAQTAKDFNDYILDAVSVIAKERGGGGYNIRKSFTQNLKYGNGTIPATDPPETMCVAAVVEIVVAAMNLYAETNPDVFSRIPISSWTKGNIASLRANIYMYAGTGSRGTGHTLDRFGLGKELTFAELRPGDFVNLNRTNRTGHAVVFLGYLNKEDKIVDQYSANVVGFRYFSAQGKGKPDAGFAYRHGYFAGYCPSGRLGAPRDCNIIRTMNPVLLNAGRMLDPDEWRYSEAVEQIKAGIRSAFEQAFPEATRAFIDDLTEVAVNQEIPPVTEIEGFFNGETTD